MYIGNAFNWELLMKKLAKEIGRRLKKGKKHLALAESCSGGYLSHLITSVPGSSVYFKGAVISYSNELKENLLGVKSKTLKKYGAVSAECACEMALGVLKKVRSDYAIATTGIAGPGGAVKGKPVGTVYIAFASKETVMAVKFNFKGSRAKVIEQTAHKGMEMLIGFL